MPDAQVPDGAIAGGDADVDLLGRALLVFTSDERGVARVGTPAGGTDLLLLDGLTQRPIRGARVEAVEQEEGFLLRVSGDEGHEPEVVQVQRGGRVTLPLSTSTPDVRGRVVRAGVRVFDDGFLAEGSLDEVMALAESEQRPNVMFLPELPPGGDLAAERFFAYRGSLPGTLLALRVDPNTPRPANGTTVRARGRIVATQGLARSGVPVRRAQVQGAVVARRGAPVAAPNVTDVQVSAAVQGVATLSWSAEASAALLGFDVGVDTSAPDRRVGPDIRNLQLALRQGDHYACVRPVFDGSDAEPQLSCVQFVAADAPAAPNLRVTVRAATGAPAITRARQPVPVEVEVQNDGDVDAEAFDVAVVVSRDGKPESGEGETRVLRFDGAPARGSSKRVTVVVPPRDGALFVAAQADPLAALVESNPRDNVGRLPLIVTPAGNNRAPVLSLSGAGAPGAVAKGQPLALAASAVDAEEGDISSRIVWSSTVNGFLGQGAKLETTSLLPGRHRIRATVKDAGVVMAPVPFDDTRGKRLGPDVWWPLQRAPLVAAEMEAPEEVVAEFVIEIVDPAQAVNSFPVISAGPDLTSSVGVPVSPLATASDPDGDALTFSWKAWLGASEVPLEGALTAAPILTPQTPGDHRLVMEVSDGKNSTRDEMVVTVVANNADPVVTLTLPPTGTVGMSVLASVTVADEDGDPVSVSYELERPAGSRAFVQLDASAVASFTPDLSGRYVLAAVADDGRGGRARVTSAIDVGAGMLIDAGVPDASPPPVDADVQPDASVSPPDAAVLIDAPVAKLGLGATCSEGWQCDSGHCTDGVCCGSACVGHCQSCALAGSLGECRDVAMGENPRQECPEGTSCNEVQQCGPFVIRDGSLPVAEGQVELVGRRPVASAAAGRAEPATCDATLGICLITVSPVLVSSEAELRAVDMNAPENPPRLVSTGVSPYDWSVGFVHGVATGRDIQGSVFAWKPSWTARQVLASEGVRQCEISPTGTHAACLTNLRQTAQGSYLMDVVMGPLGAGNPALPVVGQVHEVNSETARVEFAFSGDGAFLLVLAEPAAGASTALRAWAVAGGEPRVLVEEPDLAALEVSRDGKWVAFFRQSQLVSSDRLKGTMAVASVDGPSNVRTLAIEVVGFGFLSADDDLGYVSLPGTDTLGTLGRIADLNAGGASVLVDRVSPEHIGLSEDGKQVAALRDTDADGVLELWVGRSDGLDWRFVDERVGIEVGDDPVFSPGGDAVLWHLRDGTNVEAPATLMISKLPQVGAPFATALGENVQSRSFRANGELVFIGAMRPASYTPGVLRVFNGTQSPGKALQGNLKPGLGMVQDRVLFVVDGGGISDGAFVLDLASAR